MEAAIGSFVHLLFLVHTYDVYCLYRYKLNKKQTVAKQQAHIEFLSNYLGPELQCLHKVKEDSS